MIVLTATFGGIALTAMLAMLGYFLKSALGTLEDVRRQVSEHDTADQVLITRVGRLEDGVRELRSEVKEGFAALGNKIDQALVHRERV